MAGVAHRRSVAATWNALRRSGSAVARRWRSGLQFRVVASTILLGLMVVVLLGAYLYRAIGSGLENDRISASPSRGAALTTTAQAYFDSAVITDINSLYNTATTLVERQLVPPGADQTRYVILSRAPTTRAQPCSAPCAARGSVTTSSPTPCSRR